MLKPHLRKNFLLGMKGGLWKYKLERKNETKKTTQQFFKWRNVLARKSIKESKGKNVWRQKDKTTWQKATAYRNNWSEKSPKNIKKRYFKHSISSCMNYVLSTISIYSYLKNQLSTQMPFWVNWSNCFFMNSKEREGYYTSRAIQHSKFRNRARI